MKENYIEKRFPRYFEFGNYRSGLVDVSSPLIDPVVTVSKEQAEILIKDRNDILDMVIKLAQKLDTIDSEAFNSIWYESEEKEAEKICRL